MLNYYFQYDTTSGYLYPYLQNSAPASSATTGVLGPYPQSTASSQVVMAYTYPERFLAQGSPVALVEQPYFTLATAEASGEYTLTATLNNAPSTPPTSATFTIAGQTATGAVTNNVATLAVQLHPAVADFPINVTVGAAGCAASQPTNIGGNAQAAVSLQLYTPSGGVLAVAPVGAGSRAFLAAYYAMSPAAITALLADIGTSMNLVLDTVFSILLPASTATLTADQQNALNDIKTNVLPKLYTTLGNAYPIGGTEQLQYTNMVTDLGKTYTAFEEYAADLADIPNLA